MILQWCNLSDTFARKIGRSLSSLPPPQKPSKVPDRLMAAVSLLEKLTHARTAFSENSSRMHRYTVLQFNKFGKLVGFKFVTALLESDRVAKCGAFGPQELPFHALIGIFAPGLLSREEKDRYFLMDKPVHYAYLSNVKNLRQLPKHMVRFQQQLPTIKALFRGAGFSSAAVDDVFKILSCILLLGNLQFVVDKLLKDQGNHSSAFIFLTVTVFPSTPPLCCVTVASIAPCHRLSALAVNFTFTPG